jgi:STE24 endopeptidase
MNQFTWLFLAAMALGYLLEFWLARRQRQYVQAHADAVPADFADSISLEQHQKAARYTLAKLKFGNIGQIVGLLLLLGWTLGGGLQWLYQQIAALGLSAGLQGTVLMLVAMLLMSLLELPLAIWNTFVLEQKFGFNRETPKRFVLDQLLNLTLFVVIGAPLIWVILQLMQASGSLWWLYAWAVWIGFALFMTWAFPTWIAPLFNKFTPLENGELRERLRQLLQRCGFADNGMFVMDGSRRSSHGNAYFTGFGKNKRIVFFDTLLTHLSSSETEAVLAHELGHFKRRHIIKRLLGMALLTLAGFALLGWLKQQDWFYLGLGVQSQDNALALLLFLLVLPVFSVFFQPISSWISRRHEFEADDFATQQSNPRDLITALVKLYRDNASTLTPDPLYSAFHHSHPPAPVRIANISSKIQTSH